MRIWFSETFIKFFDYEFELNKKIFHDAIKIGSVNNFV